MFLSYQVEIYQYLSCCLQKLQINQNQNQSCWQQNQFKRLQRKMEKTVLYSKKSLPNTANIKDFQCCAHEHCKQLLSHIRYLTNVSTEKSIKEDYQSSKSLKGKQNKPSLKCIRNQTTNSIEDEIQIIKKNYMKLKKLLGHLEQQNDELQQENQILRKKLLRVQQCLNNKQCLQLSMTKCNQISPLTSKNSFYLSSPVFQVDFRNQQTSRILQKSANSNQSQLQQLNEKYCNLESQYTHLESQYSNLQSSNSNLQSQYSNLQSSYSHLQSQYSNAQLKYSHLELKYSHFQLKYSHLQLQSNNYLIQIKEMQSINRRLQYEVQQLKKIIKIRGQLQRKRHRVVGGLTNLLDQLQL